MRSIRICACLILACAQPVFAAHRVAVIVGANHGVAGREALRYSNNDAHELADVLISAGEFKPDDVHVLLEPEPAAVLAQLDSLLASASHSQEETLLLFYYSGHADDRALYPAGHPLSLDELHQRLSDARAGVRIGIIDACRGGAWTRAKGLKAEAPFAVNVPLDVASEGSVLMASSSGEESAHETDSLRGSYFTHYLVAGLRGAADTTGSGQVTLTEAFAYAQRYTVRDTSRSAQEPQHPSFDTQLHGRSDIVLTRIALSPSIISLEQTQGPLQLVQLSTGVVLLEAPSGERTLKLAVPPGAYLVRRVGQGQSWAKEILVEEGKPLTIPEASLELVGVGALVDKGPPPSTAPLLPQQGQFSLRLAAGWDQTQAPVQITLLSQSSGTSLVTASNVFTADASLQYALTDDLQLNLLLPGISYLYRYGEDRHLGGFDLIPHFGFSSFSFSHFGPQPMPDGQLSSGGTSFRYGLNGNIFWRYWAGPRGAADIEAGASSTGLLGARVDSTYEPALHGPGRWLPYLAVGWSYRFGDKLTLNLSMKTENYFSIGGSNGYQLPEQITSFGSVLSPGGRTLPLLQYSLRPDLSLDAYMKLSFGTNSGSYASEIALGMTRQF